MNVDLNDSLGESLEQLRWNMITAIKKNPHALIGGGEKDQQQRRGNKWEEENGKMAGVIFVGKCILWMPNSEY